MAALGEIRRLYVRDGRSLSEISRRTSLSRNTIRAEVCSNLVYQWGLIEVE